MSVGRVSGWQVCQLEIEAHWKVATAAALVAGMVYFLWGTMATVFYLGAILFAYVNFGSTIRVLNEFDLKGVSLAIAAFVSPFFGGIPAYLAGGLVAISLLSHEWQQYHIRADLEKNNQEFTRRVAQWEAQVDVLEKLLAACQDRNAQIADLKPKLVDQTRSAQELQADLAQKFNSFNEKIVNFRKLFEALQNDGMVKEMQAINDLNAEVIRLQGIQTQLKEEVSCLEGRLEALNARNDAVNDKLSVVVEDLQSQTNRLNQAFSPE